MNTDEEKTAMMEKPKDDAPQSSALSSPDEAKTTPKDTLGNMSGPLLHRKVNHIHKLERKHSSGDLHSRLKTRKLLGVGETDDGDVHRSKLSQILGHSEQLYTRFPRGLRLWQFALAILFTTISVWALIFPKSLYRFAVHGEAEDAVSLPVRLYGTALISFSMVFWSTLRTVDKDLIRWALLSSILYFVTQILVMAVTLLELGLLTEKVYTVLSHRILFAVVSFYYYYSITEHKPPRARKSNSTQDISSSSSTK